ncbi:hypothetical protein OG500_33785 [Kitasatospora sp. NBC_01250]|uniref:hypothetical protein n=1 Tax=unclassified Kitasatospora TaxID=2633591 RepID=UPI002E0D6B7F|nr:MULTISPECIES: hypothetical protein [unclassified Kitasatospora]WSJ70941.1 hypothetical protein OG294_35325 [Kitasatospora sp. NBC_01302]
MSIAEPQTEALRRRNEVQERHRLQLAALDAYNHSLEQMALAQAGLSRAVAGAVEAFGGLDITANLLDLTLKEVRTHVAAFEAAGQEAPAADPETVPAQAASAENTATDGKPADAGKPAAEKAGADQADAGNADGDAAAAEKAGADKRG